MSTTTTKRPRKAAPKKGTTSKTSKPAARKRPARKTNNDRPPVAAAKWAQLVSGDRFSPTEDLARVLTAKTVKYLPEGHVEVTVREARQGKFRRPVDHTVWILVASGDQPADRPEVGPVNPTIDPNDPTRIMLAQVPEDGITRADLRTAFLANSSGHDARYAGTLIGRLVREGWLVEDGTTIKLVQDGPAPAPAPEPEPEPDAPKPAAGKGGRKRASAKRGEIRPPLDFSEKQVAKYGKTKLERLATKVRRAYEAGDAPALGAALYQGHVDGIGVTTMSRIIGSTEGMPVYGRVRAWAKANDKPFPVKG